MDDTYLVPFTWVLMMVIFYPVKVIVRLVMLKISKDNKIAAWATFLLLSVVYLIFISFQSNQNIEVVLNGVTVAIPPLIFYLLYDLYKKPKLLSFLYHIATRIIVAILSIMLIIPFYLKYIFDPLFLKTMGIYIVYFIFIVRKRHKVKSIENIEEQQLPI